MGGWTVPSGLEDWDLWFRLAQAGHRVRTGTARTVSVFEGAGTRRHSVAPRYTAALLVIPGPRVAKRIRDTLRRPEIQRALAQARRDDNRNRIARLASSPLLVTPLPSAEVPHLGPVTEAEPRGPKALIVPHHGRFALAVPVFCSTPAHARRFEALLHRHAAAQLDVLRSLGGGERGHDGPRG